MNVIGSDPVVNETGEHGGETARVCFRIASRPLDQNVIPASADIIARCH